MYCTSCGNQIADGDMFCTKCGKKLKYPKATVDTNQTNDNAGSNTVQTPVGLELKEKKKPLRIIIPVLIILAAVIGIVVYVYAGTPERRYKRQIDVGNRYLSELQYEQAVASFEKAVSIDPKKPDAYIGLVNVYDATDDMEMVLATYESASESVEPDDLGEIEQEIVQSVDNRIQVLVDQSEYEEVWLLVSLITERLDIEDLQKEKEKWEKNIRDKYFEDIIDANIKVDDWDDATSEIDEETLLHFLIYFSMYDGADFDYRNIKDSDFNILEEMLEMVPCIDARMFPGYEENVLTVYGETDPLDAFPPEASGYYQYEASFIDWIAINVFQCDEDDIEMLRGGIKNKQACYYHDGYYYAMYIGRGLSVPEYHVDSIKTDGTYYVIDYSQVGWRSEGGIEYFTEENRDFYGWDTYDLKHRTVMQYKETDGFKYWSICYHEMEPNEGFAGVDMATVGGQINVRDDILNLKGLKYGELRKKYKITAAENDYSHGNVFCKRISEIGLDIGINSKNWIGDGEPSDDDTAIYISAMAGNIFTGLNASYTPEDFASLITHPDGLKPSFSREEGAGTMYYIADKYCVIHFDTDGDGKHDMSGHFSLRRGDFIDSETFVWLYTSSP